MANAPTTIEEAHAFKPTAPLSAYARIFELGAERVAALNNFLITESHTYEQIIHILKTEWKVFGDVKESALKRQLIRYKNDFIVPKQAEIAAKLTSDANVHKLVKVTGQLQQTVDALKRLEWAINIQTRRVKKLMLKEKGPLGVHLKDQTDNLYLLTSQVTALAKLQMDVGILKKVPKKIALSAGMSEEELKFAEKAQLHVAEATATAEALRYLRGHKLLTEAAAQTVEVPHSSAEVPDATAD